MNNNQTSTPETMSSFTNELDDNDRMLIVLAAPSVNDEYYKEVFEQTIVFDIQLAETVIGHDNVVMLANKDTMPYLLGRAYLTMFF